MIVGINHPPWTLRQKVMSPGETTAMGFMRESRLVGQVVQAVLPAYNRSRELGSWNDKP